MTFLRAAAVALLAPLAIACGASPDASPLPDPGSTSPPPDGTDAGPAADAATEPPADGASPDSAAPEGDASSPSTPADPSTCAEVKDECPAPNGGLTFACKKRFLYGVNYAWSGQSFGQEFGGVSAWNTKGITGDPESRLKDLKDMRAHGVDAVRWWVYPELLGDGVAFDANGNPTGLGGTAVADFAKALSLAKEADLHIVFCLFSFDGFRADRDVNGAKIRSIQPFVADSARRATFIDNVVRPIARAVMASPDRDRLVAWDVVNEPEWAMTGTDAYGDPAFEPSKDMQAVTHPQMEAFVRATAAALRDETKSAKVDAPLVTVGGAALKWAKAWTKSDLDFYQFHTYDWVEQYYPYTKPLSDYGVSDKPVVMGEFPFKGVASVDFTKLVSDLYRLGYAGAMGWAYNDPNYPFAPYADAVKAFADGHSCQTRY